MKTFFYIVAAVCCILTAQYVERIAKAVETLATSKACAEDAGTKP